MVHVVLHKRLFEQLLRILDFKENNPIQIKHEYLKCCLGYDVEPVVLNLHVRDFVLVHALPKPRQANRSSAASRIIITFALRFEVVRLHLLLGFQFHVKDRNIYAILLDWKQVLIHRIWASWLHLVFQSRTSARLATSRLRISKGPLLLPSQGHNRYDFVINLDIIICFYPLLLMNWIVKVHYFKETEDLLVHWNIYSVKF